MTTTETAGRLDIRRVEVDGREVYYVGVDGTLIGFVRERDGLWERMTTSEEDYSGRYMTRHDAIGALLYVADLPPTPPTAIEVERDALRAEVSRLRGVLDTLRTRLEAELADLPPSRTAGRDEALRGRLDGEGIGMRLGLSILAELYPPAGKEGEEK